MFDLLFTYLLAPIHMCTHTYVALHFLCSTPPSNPNNFLSVLYYSSRLTCALHPNLNSDEGWNRYKFAVQVFIGEQRGEGVR